MIILKKLKKNLSEYSFINAAAETDWCVYMYWFKSIILDTENVVGCNVSQENYKKKQENDTKWNPREM